VRELICDPETNVNWRSNGGFTPLLLACFLDMPSILKILLHRHDVDVNVIEKSGLSPFDLGCGQGNSQILEILLSDPRLDVPPLFHPCFFGRGVELMDMLRQGWVDVNETTPFGFSPLHLAATLNKLEMVSLLLSSHKINVNAQTKDGKSPFFIVCQKRESKESREVVRLLASDPRLEVDQVNSFIQTPIWKASVSGNRDAVEIILAHHQDVDTQRHPPRFSSAADEAMEGKQYEIAKLIRDYSRDPGMTRLRLRRKRERDG